MKTAVLFSNPRKPEDQRWLRALRELLRKRGVRVVSESSDYASASFALAVGGDGTMLSAARSVAPLGIPLAGINTGGLGFLSGTETSNLQKDLASIVEGRFPVEERKMLEVEVRRDRRRILGPVLALNDCVVRPGGQARAFYLRASLHGEFLSDYFGDGLIVSTPTGSTAYSLAAMGPIVEPGLDALVITPICPHTVTQRPLILPTRGPFVMELKSRRPRDRVPAVVSMDGQINRTVGPGDRVIVTTYEKPFRLLVNPRRSYFEVLRTKLGWGSPAQGRRI